MRAPRMSNQACYALQTPVESPAGARAFEPQAFDPWLTSLAGRGAAGMLVNLVLKLQELGRVSLSVPCRLEVNLRLLPVVKDLADELPKPPFGRHGPQGSEPLTLEQRLWCQVFSNLQRTLRDLDSAHGAEVHDRDWARLWLLEGLLHCLGRQLELSLGGRGSLPPGTWQSAHDLSAYYSGRVAEAPRLRDLAERTGGEFDITTAYKRLLVLSLLDQQGPPDLLVDPETGQVPEVVGDWAQRSKLQEPSLYFGVLGTYLVEISRDEPPRRVPGALGSVERAWVLRVPRDLLTLLGG